MRYVTVVFVIAVAVVAATAPAAAQSEEQAIAKWLAGYDAALNARDLDRLATFYHPDAAIVESAGVNNGWADYRDHHLGLELKAFETLKVRLRAQQYACSHAE